MLVGISVAVMILMLLGSSGSGELDPSCGFTRAQGESRHCLSLRVQLYLNRKAGPHLGASILEETRTLNPEVLTVQNHFHKDMAGLFGSRISQGTVVYAEEWLWDITGDELSCLGEKPATVSKTRHFKDLLNKGNDSIL